MEFKFDIVLFVFSSVQIDFQILYLTAELEYRFFLFIGDKPVNNQPSGELSPIQPATNSPSHPIRPPHETISIPGSLAHLEVAHGSIWPNLFRAKAMKWSRDPTPVIASPPPPGLVTFPFCLTSRALLGWGEKAAAILES